MAPNVWITLHEFIWLFAYYGLGFVSEALQ